MIFFLKKPKQLKEVLQIFVHCSKIKSTFHLFFCLIILSFLCALLLPSASSLTKEIERMIEEEEKERKKPRQNTTKPPK